MNPLIESMQNLQRLLHSGTHTKQENKQIADLRVSLPAPVLAHFDRLVAHGRKGVAEVRHGVCGGCHLKLPASLSAPGLGHEDLQLCESCGAYLNFIAEETASSPLVVRMPRKRRYRATAVAAEMTA
jgi:predicted  nucleic acid-binding Zn-ribbon protein